MCSERQDKGLLYRGSRRRIEATIWDKGEAEGESASFHIQIQVCIFAPTAKFSLLMYFGERLREFLVVLFYFSDDIGKTVLHVTDARSSYRSPGDPISQSNSTIMEEGWEATKLLLSTSCLLTPTREQWASIHWGKVLSNVQFEDLPHLIPIWSKSSKHGLLAWIFHDSISLKASDRFGS